MKEHFSLLCDAVAFPAEADKYLREVGNRVFTLYGDEIARAADSYTDGAVGIEEAAATLHPIAAELGIPTKTMDLLFVACASKWLREAFRRNGYTDELFWNTMADLRCKAVEAHTVYGEWGVDCLLWYDLFFEQRLFWLGRLQYERRTMPLPQPITIGGYTLNPGETVYSIHIPSSGPLTREARMDSYRQAYRFFEKELQGKPLPCCCLSWLLFPQNREIFPPHLNIIDFMDDFKIVGSELNHCRDLWRVFGVPYNGDLAALPRDNTMRRAFGEWLDRGGQPGYGIGVFLFDGETIIND